MPRGWREFLVWKKKRGWRVNGFFFFDGLVQCPGPVPSGLVGQLNTDSGVGGEPTDQRRPVTRNFLDIEGC
jgi:hypothetical protein